MQSEKIHVPSCNEKKNPCFLQHLFYHVNYPELQFHMYLCFFSPCGTSFLFVWKQKSVNWVWKIVACGVGGKMVWSRQESHNGSNGDIQIIGISPVCPPDTAVTIWQQVDFFDDKEALVSCFKCYIALLTLAFANIIKRSKHLCIFLLLWPRNLLYSVIRWWLSNKTTQPSWGTNP